MVRLSCVIGRSKFMGSCCEGLQQNGAAKQRGTQQKRRRKNEETRKQAEVNVNQIRYFVSVAQEGSLSQAARLHGVTAQAISKSINELERDVKEPLFFREHSGMRLTTFGQGFFERAKDALTAFDNLQAMVSEGNLASAQIQFEESDKLRVFVCAPSFSMKDSAMRQATSFAEAFLGTPTELSLGSGQEGMKGLDKGAYDAIITIGTLSDPDFECLTVGHVHVCACLSKSHPLAKRESVTMDDLASFPVIFSPTFDQFNDSILLTYKKAGLASPFAEHSGVGAAGAFYFKNAYALMASIPALGEMLPFSTTVPLAEKDRIPIPLCLILPKGRSSQAARKLERLLKSRPASQRYNRASRTKPAPPLAHLS